MRVRHLTRVLPYQEPRVEPQIERGLYFLAGIAVGLLMALGGLHYTVAFAG